MKPVSVAIGVPQSPERVCEYLTAPLTRAVVRRANARSLHRLVQALAEQLG